MSSQATVAGLVSACALQRQESRGGHFCLDHPSEREDQRRPSLVSLAPAPHAVPAGLPLPSLASSSSSSSSSSRGRRGVSGGNGGNGGGGAGKKLTAAPGPGKAGVAVPRDLVTRSLPPGEP